MKNKLLLIIMIILNTLRLFAADRPISISGSADFLKNGDSVNVAVHQYTSRLEEIRKAYTAYADGHRFKLLIPGADKPEYLDIYFNNQENTRLTGLILLPGEELEFHVEGGQFEFLGSSAAKYRVQRQIQLISDDYARQYPGHFTPETLPMFYNYIDSSANSSLALLEAKKAQTGPLLYGLMRADICAGAAATKLAYLSNTCLGKPREVQECFLTAFKKYGRAFNNFPAFVYADSKGVPSSSLSESVIYEQYLADSCVFSHRPFNLRRCYLYESTHFKGEIRERLVTALFLSKRHNAETSAADIENALSYVKNQDFRKILTKIKRMNTIGKMSPEFTLRDADDRVVNLKDFRGKVVMLDFWFTGCASCRGMAPVLAKLEKKYEHLPVVFVTICIDKKREQWLNTLKAGQYTSALSVNLYTEGQGDLHRVIQDFDVRGFPTFILVDKDGRIGLNPTWSEAGMSKLIDSYL